MVKNLFDRDRISISVIFMVSDVSPGGHLAGRHQLLLDVSRGWMSMSMSIEIVLLCFNLIPCFRSADSVVREAGLQKLQSIIL